MISKKSFIQILSSYSKLIRAINSRTLDLLTQIPQARIMDLRSDPEMKEVDWSSQSLKAISSSFKVSGSSQTSFFFRNILLSLFNSCIIHNSLLFLMSNVFKALAFARSPAGQSFFKGKPLYNQADKKKLIERVKYILKHSPCRIRIKHYCFENTRGTVPYYHFERKALDIPGARTVQEWMNDDYKQKGVAISNRVAQTDHQLTCLIAENKEALQAILKRANKYEVISLNEELSKIEHLEEEEFLQYAKRL